MTAGDARPLALFLEPDLDTAEMYAEYFAMYDWRTETAADGAVGLSKAIALAPDAVILETRLPVIDGVHAVRILKADPDTASIPLIAVTSDTRQDQIARLHEAGCDLVLAKPCLPGVLLDEVRRVRERAKQARARSPQAIEHAAALTRQATDLRSDALAGQRRARAVAVKTTTPEVRPPALTCPRCDAALEYEYSIVGGVARNREQWDYLRCPRGCGPFQYRPRSRRLRPA